MASQLRLLMDARGLVKHAYKASRTSMKSPHTGNEISSAADGMKAFLDMWLKPALQRVAPINLVAVWEGGNDRRRMMLPTYKSTESSEDKDPSEKKELEDLIVGVKGLLAGLGALQVYTPHAEADDTLAYLCERLDGQKLVWTVDGDLLALLKYPSTAVHGPHIKDGGEFYKGHPVRHITLYKSIVGDKTDKYPGIPGLGEKAFDELVNTVGYDGLDELENCVRDNNYALLEMAIKESSDKLLTKIYEARIDWRRSYELARLHPEWCEMSFNSKLVRPTWYKRLPDRERCEKSLEAVKLSRTIPSYMDKFMPTQTGIDRDSYAMADWADIEAQCKRAGEVGFDYESYDSAKNPAFKEANANYVDVLAQRVTGASYCFGSNYQHSIYASMNHRDTKNLSEEQFLSVMATCLGDTTPVAQNCKFEQVLSKTNFDITFDKIYDTAIMASYVDEEMEQHLKGMSKKILNYDQTTYQQVVGTEGKDMRDISLDEVLHYGCDDAFVTMHLFVLYKIILECEQTWTFVDMYETNFDAMFVDSFIRGIPVDLDYLRQLEKNDDALYLETYAKLRNVLTEHCSDYNREGFEAMWADLEPFYRADVIDRAGKNDEVASEEQINAKLDEKYNDLWAACRYVPQEEPYYLFAPFKGAALSKTAQTLGLASIRVTKPDKLQAWCTGMRLQSMQNETPFTPRQAEFVDLLQACAIAAIGEKCEVFEYEDLEEFCKAVTFTNPELYTGDELSMRSSKQVAELLYGKMGLPILLRNEDKTGEKARTRYDLEGAPSTSEIAIRTLMMQYDIEDIDLDLDAEEEAKLPWQVKVLLYILQIRGIDQRRSLYYQPYPLWAKSADGRIHPGIRNCGTKTRRPSGSQPNILQVSKKEGALMRGVFLPLPDDVAGEPQLIVSIDFVQQELVIMAGESGDPNLRACYVGDSRRDVHSSTAAALMKLPYDEFMKAYKDKESPLHKRAVRTRKKLAKTVNFLMTYGGSAIGLARKAVIAQERADTYLAAYFDMYERVKVYQDRMESLALRHGFVTDCFGNRKHCDGIYSDNKRQQRALARQAGNQPVQGGAASVLKIAVTNIRKMGVLDKTGATLYAPIYDEIVASVPVSKIVEYIRMMEQCMEMELPGLNIGLNTSVSLGRNWMEASTNELGEKPSAELINEAVQKIMGDMKETAHAAGIH